MTTVWKSQPKKFCEICKCWFADNRVSIQFHESGMKHKINIQKKLSEAGRKGSQRDRQEKDKSRALAKMELAALQAYQKDIKNNPEVVPQYNIHLNVQGLNLPKSQSLGTSQSHKYSCGYGYRNSNFFATDAAPNKLENNQQQMQFRKKWAEAITSDGQPYFWNIESGETSWESPKDGYLTISEQNAMGYDVSEYKKYTETTEICAEPTTYNTSISTPSIEQSMPESLQSFREQSKQQSKVILKTNKKKKSKHRSCEIQIQRPTTKSQYVRQDKKNANDSSGNSSDDEDSKSREFCSVQATSAAPLPGKWQPVVADVKQTIDFQLPSVNALTTKSQIDIDIKPEVYEQPKIRFKEKTIQIASKSLNNVEPILFKKRRITSGTKNSRQREDD